MNVLDVKECGKAIKMRDISLNKLREISRNFHVDEKTLRQTISKVIFDARSNSGLSQQKLGNIADVDRSYISEIERSMRTPTLYTLFRIAKALNIEPQMLVAKIQDHVKWDE